MCIQINGFQPINYAFYRTHESMNIKKFNYKILIYAHYFHINNLDKSKTNTKPYVN